jgi:GDP-L-fucose synthase
MNVLLLGAGGFVGSNVRLYLENRGLHILCSAGKQDSDLRSISETKRLFEKTKPDVIVNCSAHVGSLHYVTEHAATVVLDNTRMIMNMYEAAAQINPSVVIINPVANCAYPAKADTYKEDQWWDGHLHRSVLSYGSTRRLLWSVGESFEMQHGIRSLYLLVPNMYGPFDSTDPNKAHALTALISKFVKADKLGNREMKIWGTGVAIREWLYAEDFAKCIGLILSDLNRIGLSEPINIAQNFGLTVKELVHIINGHFENKFSISWNSSMPDGAPKKVMDDTRFKKVFPGFEFTPLEQGIVNTIQYYKSIYPY